VTFSQQTLLEIRQAMVQLMEAVLTLAVLAIVVTGLLALGVTVVTVQKVENLL